MAAVQLSFNLRLSSGVKTVHLLGSWDNYSRELPLAKDKSSSAKSGAWKGTFKSMAFQHGQRYWYYYIIDGYHVSHDPAQSSTTEPTTGRVLNILDVPHSSSSKEHKSSSSSKTSSSKHHSSSDRDRSSRDKPSSTSTSSRHSSSQKNTSSTSRRESRRDSLSLSVDIPKGRPLSVSQIKSPKPLTPHATKYILEADYSAPTVEELTSRFSVSTMDDYYSLSASPPSSVGSSLSSRSDNSSPSSASSLSDYSNGTPRSGSRGCTCERYGITRGGDRVKLDCGGSRCGYSDDSSSCCSSDDEYAQQQQSSRRNGLVVRR